MSNIAVLHVRTQLMLLLGDYSPIFAHLLACLIVSLSVRLSFRRSPSSSPLSSFICTTPRTLSQYSSSPRQYNLNPHDHDTSHKTPLFISATHSALFVHIPGAFFISLSDTSTSIKNRFCSTDPYVASKSKLYASATKSIRNRLSGNVGVVLV